jgi:hypothetical protein
LDVQKLAHPYPGGTSQYAACCCSHGIRACNTPDGSLTGIIYLITPQLAVQRSREQAIPSNIDGCTAELKELREEFIANYESFDLGGTRVIVRVSFIEDFVLWWDGIMDSGSAEVGH